ncbi:MAG: acetolactate decarboxylase [Campylobacterales bacterium]|nr:acetolactate decarboxylase [Campylobacterales bacterium]
MKYFVLVFIFFATFVHAKEIWNKEVFIHGVLDNELQLQSSSKLFDLATLANRPNLYGIGLLENLQGEVQIFDSDIFISSIDSKGQVKVDKNFDKKIPFFVYTFVPDWVKIKIPSTIYNKNQFEDFLEETIKEYGISKFQTFPFMIEGEIKTMNYRIYSYLNNDRLTCENGMCSYQPKQIQSNKKYISLTKYKTIINTPVKILGFYSLKHGIVTEKSKYTNLNFIYQNQTIAGHVRNMMIGENMILKLPKVEITNGKQ